MPQPPDIPEARPVEDSPGRGRPQVVYYQPARRSVWRVLGGLLVAWILIVSLLANVILLLVALPQFLSPGELPLTELYYSGDDTSSDKIAVVRIEGVLLEGSSGFHHDQLRSAARDDAVRAVVLAVDSPGGSVTASDQLHKQICDLRDGKWPLPSGGTSSPKPVVVAMGGVAASGGYYISVPGQKIYAEPTTITGSIGVYAAVLDIHELAERHGIRMHLIKKGELKGSGSLLKEFTPEERAEFDEMAEAAYQRFMQIVRQGRKDRLKADLREELQVPSLVRQGDTVLRRLADGGIFIAEQAKQYGLVDEIGYLDDAIAEATRLAGLKTPKVILYQEPFSLWNSLMEVRRSPARGSLDLRTVPGFSTRLWYLTPGYELAGLKLELPQASQLP
jgi:protease-4